MDQDRTAMYDWRQQAKQVMEQGGQAGKSSEEIHAMMPAPPVLSGQGSSRPAGSSGKPGMIQQFVEATGIGGVLEKISPWLEQMELAYSIPQKPDYLSKQTQKTVYLSRYTFEELIIGPQVLIAEFNIIFGVVAIIAAIPTGGGSLYMLAVADAALGVSMIVVNAEKLNDLKNGNANTNPTFLGMDQDLLDKLGITLMVVNLAMLAKHGLNKAADKLVNSKNSSALGDTWAAWKQQVQHDPAAASGKTGPKTAKSKPSRGTLGGPGKNRPFDEFDDSRLYDEASKGRTSAINKVESLPKTEGTGKVVTKLEPRGNPIDYPIEVRQDQIAVQTYKKLRLTGLDEQEIQTFAKNTGLSTEEAKALKEHMILTKHENLVNQYEGTYYSDYFHPVWDVAHGWERALKGELSADEKAYFRKLADHELAESQLMQQGVPYRNVGGIENQKFTGDPPGAHELAPPQPDDYPYFRPDMRDPK
ncbi:hypothetical protein [Paenibacillus xylanivorans]|uniref:Uncharacterized protein n=2 Tax=Paenibacillus xylanivorans TaxID=1705561 RepID=A0A0M9BIP2_9BACL|nr:hypothetical protein [Paenibacillus xylanivorans]KOY12729.1 hypothetical protein AMS66_30495 [Paenibacillus xylanivorans]